MRVLFVTLPFKAHLYPRVPLAWALRAAGHEVRVAGHPDLVEEITSTGLTAVPVGEALDQGDRMAEIREYQEAEKAAKGEVPDPEALMRMDELRPRELTPDFLQGLFTVMTTVVFQRLSEPRMTDDLVAFARQWRPHLVVWDPLSFAGAVAARSCGAAHARLMYGLDLIGRMRQSYRESLARRPPELREDPVAEWLDPVLRRYGCEFGEDVLLGQWTIDPGPPEMRLEVDHQYVPVRHVSYNGRATVAGWLREPPKRRRVCLTLGLSHREVLGGNQLSINGLLEAVADVDAEVVATLNADQMAGVSSVPDNVRVVDFAPMNELLATCSAVMHQGGTGTSQTALAHGVPQVILPGELWDTMLKAEWLERAGVALHTPAPESATAGQLRAMLLRVLDEPSFARNAGRLRTEMLGMPAPADIVPLLERLTVEHHGSRNG
ncbi:activator-dependent family glycosyltransferase [Actinomadura sp. KC345]|uniref:activator-dependent family glycosyltransferase n=1 Tax=Actinomadura sp. KC345 TaxID=2530371 RepID=UPI00104A54CE|nr:activator-dependent family glycosyltransferase [Actinomadura sp. KC345]TDC54724.1 activator-dependent family glycosyltransferase [Actinomadura sp. KC345]